MTIIASANTRDLGQTAILLAAIMFVTPKKLCIYKNSTPPRKEAMTDGVIQYQFLLFYSDNRSKNLSVFLGKTIKNSVSS